MIIGLIIQTNLMAQPHNKKDTNYKPKDLEESIQQLDILLHDTIKAGILLMTEKEFTTATHMSTGLWMRNNWGLWRGGKLSRYFNSIGIHHPDNMSGIILTSYHRHLNQKDIDLENQVLFYQEFSKKIEEHFYKMDNDTAYKKQIEAQQETLKNEHYNNIKKEYPPGTKVYAWVNYGNNIFSGSTRIVARLLNGKIMTL